MSYKNPPEHSKWQKGQSGNPAGRPIGSVSLTGKLKEIMGKELSLKDPIDNQLAKKEVGEIIALQLTAKAIKGDLRAIETIFKKVEGIMDNEKEDVNFVFSWLEPEKTE